MKDRLKELRKALHLTQQKLADKLGVKQNTFAQYEMGRNEPSDAVIVSYRRCHFWANPQKLQIPYI